MNEWINEWMNEWMNEKFINLMSYNFCKWLTECERTLTNKYGQICPNLTRMHVYNTITVK